VIHIKKFLFNLTNAEQADGQINQDLVKGRDERLGVSTEAKRELRKGYLPPYEPVPGADEWTDSGHAIQFEPVKRPIQK
jgi:hypothetical protein